MWSASVNEACKWHTFLQGTVLTTGWKRFQLAYSFAAAMPYPGYMQNNMTINSDREDSSIK